MADGHGYCQQVRTRMICWRAMQCNGGSNWKLAITAIERSVILERKRPVRVEIESYAL